MVHTKAAAVLSGALFLGGCATSSLSPVENAQSSQLEHDMIGTWVHVGSPGREMPMPESGGRFKHRTGDHWNLTVVEPETGLVTQNFGGTYVMKGAEYIETQQYATPHWIQDNGQSWRFRVSVQGDTMIQHGIDNSFHEVWKRVSPDWWQNAGAQAGGNR